MGPLTTRRQTTHQPRPSVQFHSKMALWTSICGAYATAMTLGAYALAGRALGTVKSHLLASSMACGDPADFLSPRDTCQQPPR